VNSGATLTIASGVEIQIASGIELLVNGRLDAIGAETNRITFTRRPADTYGGLLEFAGTSFSNTATGNLEYCTFTCLGASFSTAVGASYAVMSVRRCSFSQMPQIGMEFADSRISIYSNDVSNVSADADSLDMTRCAGIISSNHLDCTNCNWNTLDINYAWAGPGDPTLIIENNFIASCNTRPEAWDADCIDLGTSPAIVRGNVLCHPYDKGVSVGEDTPTSIYNNLIYDCGIGIAVKDGSIASIMNNTIMNCSTGIACYLKSYAGGHAFVTNTIVWNCMFSITTDTVSTVTVNYSCIQGTSVWSGAGNITNDPQFANAAQLDCRLLRSSPCVNTGLNMPWMTNSPDIIGNPRIVHVTVDMGAYEFAIPLRLSLPPGVTEGDGVLTGQGIITIPESQPSDTVITLTSSDTSELTVTGSVTIAAGQTNVTFSPAVVDDAELDGTQTAVITATGPWCIPTNAAVAIRDNETATLTVTLPATAREGDGVLAGAGHVYVSAPVSTNVTITLTSSDTTELIVTNAVVIPTGQTNASFDLQIIDDAAIDGPQLATVTAHVDNWTDGSNTMTVIDNGNTNLTITLPASAAEGDAPVTGRVSIRGTMLTNLIVSLVSSDTSEVTVTSQVVILAGQTSATFSVAIVDDALMDGSQMATVTASAVGFADGSAGMTVYDNDVHHFDLTSISSPQTAGVPFSVTITARDINGATVTVYGSSVRLSAAGDAANVPLQPTNTTAFTGGVWSGSVKMLGVGSNVRLTATNDVIGCGVQSNPFQVLGALISVVPSALTNVPVVVSNTASRMLTISNAGNIDLTWNMTQPGGDFFDDIEKGTNGWSHSGTGDLWHISTNRCYSTNHAWYCGSDVTKTYANSMDCTLVSAPFVPDSSTKLSFRHWYYMEPNYDYGYVDISTNNWTNYVALSTFNGSSGAWLAKTNDLSPYAGKQTWTRFRFHSDSSVAYEGWYMDDIHISKQGGTNSWLTLSATNGIVPPMSATNVLITFNATGCSTGQHVAASIALACNDAVSPSTNVPVSMDVCSMLALGVSIPAVATEGDGVLTNAGVVSIPNVQASDVVVAIASSDASEVTVTNTVTILAGQTSTVFDVTIVDDPILDGSQAATVSASASGYGTGNCSITVQDNESATLSVVLPASVLEGSGTVTGRVTVGAMPYSDVGVSLTWSNYSRLMVPTNVTILNGQTSATFNVTASNDTQINGSQVATVTAHVANWADGISTMIVLDDENTNLTVALPASATEGNAPVTGRVSISGTMLTNLTVSLVSSDTSEVTVTNQILILAGQTSATFNVVIVDDALTDGSQTATVTASAVGFASGSAGITVYDNDVHHFDLTAISSPQTASVPFGVTITARDINGATVTVYGGSVRLSAAGDSGNVPIQPTNTTAFAGGIWSGNVKLLGVGSNVRLTATNDATACWGQSNPFEVQGALISVIPNALTNIPVVVNGSSIRTLMITNSGNENLTFTIPTSSSVNTNGLVLYYSFETNENGVVTDLSGNANTGTVYGATWTTNGPANGGAYIFDGTNDYILVNDSTSLRATNLTISVWHYYSFSGGTGLEMMLEKCPHDGCWEFMNYNNGLVWVRGGAANPYLHADTVFSTGVWHHIVSTISNTTATIYTDGIQTKSGPVAAVQVTSQPIYIGCSYRLGSKQDWLHGKLDEIRIYNRTLSSNEVLTLYQNPGSGGLPGWLSVQAASGVVPPGGSTNITVTFDATGCVTGQHLAASMIIMCNDAVTPSINVPVSMDVVPPAYWLGLWASGQGRLDVSSGWFLTGTNVTITATASNYYHFAGWTGTTNGGTIAGSIITVCMDCTRNITGRFDENLATNQTPEWWLALNGLTNRTWDVEALDDQDGDGMATWQEYVAGTSPTNRPDCLKIIQVCPSSMNSHNIVVVWQTVTGRNYTVMMATNLSSWTNVPDSAYTNIPGTIPSLCYTNSSLTNSPQYFRVKTRRPE
jgi:hypothetical protein